MVIQWDYLFQIGVGQLAVDAVNESSHRSRVYDEGLLSSITETALCIGEVSVPENFSGLLDFAKFAAGFADDGTHFAFVVGFHFEADEVNFATFGALERAFGDSFEFGPGNVF